MTSHSSSAQDKTTFSHIQATGFEEVVFCEDPEIHLRSIIAVHSTKLGPSLGGCRLYNYANDDAALDDSLRLAEAMTYKAALAGLSLGGGKAVILGDPEKNKNGDLWQAFARFVDRLEGKYITTVDSGTTPADMDQIRKHTRYVVGMTHSNGGSGDPSPTTALGVAEGIRACAKFAFGSDDMSRKTVALQGVGNVGFPLAKLLHQMGARLVVSDTGKHNLERVVKEVKAEVVDPKDIFSVKCDVFSPCALGRALNRETLGQLKCSIVAGAANNQLETEEIGDELHQKGILYAPDFAVNAGGLIHVASEWTGFDQRSVESQTRKIYDTITAILQTSRDEKRPTSMIALALAKQRLGS